MASEAAIAASDAAAAKATMAAMKAVGPDCVGSPRDLDGSMHAAQSSVDATAQRSAEPAAHTITAEELALAMNAGTPSVSSSGSGSGDCEWEDAVELSPGAAIATVAGSMQPPATRRDMWTRTHGYKFGRKLAEWSDGREEASEGLSARDPVDVAAIEAVVAATEHGEAGDSVQEARKLQTVILQSLEEQDQPVAGSNSFPEQEALVQKDPGAKCVRFDLDRVDELRSDRAVTEDRSEQERVDTVDDVVAIEAADVQPTNRAQAVCSSVLAAAGNSRLLNRAILSGSDTVCGMLPATDGAAKADFAGGADQGGCAGGPVAGSEGCSKGVGATSAVPDRARVELGSSIALPSLKDAQQRRQRSDCSSMKAIAGAGEQHDPKPSEQGAAVDVTMVDCQDREQAGVADAVGRGEFEWVDDQAAQDGEAGHDEQEAIVADTVAMTAEESPHKQQSMQNTEPSSAISVVCSLPASEPQRQTAGHSEPCLSLIHI